MSARTGRRRLDRRQKIVLSLVLLTAGTAALVGIGLLIRTGRDTDRADPAIGLTAEHLQEDIQAPPIRFSEVGEEVGLAMRHGPGERARTLPEDTGSGLAWSDVDGDGDFDLYVVNFPGPWGRPPGGGAQGRNGLFRNDGARFTEVTAAAGVGDAEGYGMGATFADYDGDGDEDLYVTNLGPNRLFRNRGDGTFEDVSVAAGVADPSWSTGATWGDFDRDGHLDLYVCNYVDYDAEDTGEAITVGRAGGRAKVPFTLNPNGFNPQPNRLYRNLGNGTFEEVARAAGVDNPEGRSLAASFCDLDGDGWLDLYVNNDVSANRLYVGRGAAGAPRRFDEIAITTGAADPRGSMGLSIAELGGLAGMQDELPDLFITHWVAQENALYLSILHRGRHLEYRDKNRQLRLGEISLDRVGWGSGIVDLDRDGRPDLAVANGSTLESEEDVRRLAPEPIFLLWNTGRSFVDVAARAGPALARPYTARGLAAADFDGDGDVDLAVSVNRGRPLLLRNDTPSSHRGLAVRLEAPPALAHGARVEVHAGPTRQIRWWAADVSYCSRHAPELVFGLGAVSEARVRVHWLDGSVTEQDRVPAGRVIIRPGGD